MFLLESLFVLVQIFPGFLSQLADCLLLVDWLSIEENGFVLLCDLGLDLSFGVELLHSAGVVIEFFGEDAQNFEFVGSRDVVIVENLQRLEPFEDDFFVVDVLASRIVTKQTGLFLNEASCRFSGSYSPTISSIELLERLSPNSFLRSFKFYTLETRLSLRARYSRFLRWLRP